MARGGLSIEPHVGANRDLFKQLLRESLQEVLAARTMQVLGAGRGERNAERSGGRAGYHRGAS